MSLNTIRKGSITLVLALSFVNCLDQEEEIGYVVTKSEHLQLLAVTISEQFVVEGYSTYSISTVVEPRSEDNGHRLSPQFRSSFTG